MTSPLLTREEIGRARKEISRLSSQEIEFETSRAWAARAVAAYEDAGSRCDVERLSEAFGYHQEAIEHAAFASLSWLEAISTELMAVRAAAVEVFERSLFVGDSTP